MRRRLLGAATAAAIGAALALAPAPAQADIVLYTMLSDPEFENYATATPQLGPAQNAYVHMSKAGPTDWQRWTMTPQGQGTAFVNARTKGCLRPHPADPSTVVTATCVGMVDQQWLLKESAEGGTYLVNTRTGTCLTRPAKADSPLLLSECAPGAGQDFHLIV